VEPRLTLFVGCLGAFALGACTCGGPDPRSQAYACGSDQDCAEGYACVDGVCATGDGGAPPLDAGADAGALDAGPGTDGGSDAGSGDGGARDGGAADAGPTDAGMPDAGPPDAGPGHITFVQLATTSGDTPTLTLAFDAGVRAGDLLVVGLDYQFSHAFVSISDSLGNTFRQVGNELLVDAGGPGGEWIFNMRLYYAAGVDGGTDAVSVTVAGADAGTELYIHEYAGADPSFPLDAQAGAAGLSAGFVSSGSSPTTAPNDLVFGFCITGYSDAGPGFTLRSAFHANLTEDETLASPGAASATAYVSSSWGIQMAAFKP